ncbi:MAG: hypothetical protein WDZ27_00735 [Waddliaceae bacterium]
MTNTFWVTILLTFVLCLIATFFLGISYFLTGKSTYRVGRCGKNPKEERDRKNKGCGDDPTCPLCGTNDETSKKSEDDDVPKKSA